MRRRRTIERRARVFLGCEGESEQGYGAFLQRLADAKNIKVHVVAVNLQPAGDPLKLAQKAAQAFDREMKKGGPFAGQAVMFDTDRLADLRDGGQAVRTILARKGFVSIWQRPDHEGFLLRHFEGHERRDPPAGASMGALTALWPGYHKNMSASELQTEIGLEHVLRAASVEPDLRTLLALIHLLP